MAGSRIQKKIYYHDTDCGGVVYYANYLKYLEEGRTEYLSGRGVDILGLSKRGTWFVVARVEADYKAPARYQDQIGVITEIKEVRRSAIRFSQQIVKDDTVLLVAEILLVCVGQDFKPISIPADIKGRLLPGALGLKA